MLLSLALSAAVSMSSGGLLADHLPRGVRLLDAPRALAGPPPAFPSPEEPVPGDYQSMSLPELKAAYARLGESKPSGTLGGVLLGVGIGALVLGLTAMSVGLLAPLLGWTVVGLVVAAAGLALVIAGPILMTNGIRAAKAVEREQEFIRRQMRLLEGGTAPLPANPGRLPPPPPPPPPLGALGEVGPGLALAHF